MQAKAWYLIYTKVKQENVALQNLENQGFDAYLPMTQQLKRSVAGHKTVQVPLFARYLFIQLNLGKDDISKIRSTRGVIKLVEFGHVPAKVPDNLIEYIKQMCQLTLQDDVFTKKFTPGVKVKIVGGVMSGCEAIFQRRTSQQRVVVLLDIIGRSSSLQIAQNDIDVIKE